MDGTIKLYTRSDTSKMVGLHPNTLLDWEKQGFIHPIRTAGNRPLRLYTEKLIEDIIKLKELRS